MPEHGSHGRIPDMMEYEISAPLTVAAFAHGWKNIGAAFGVSVREARRWAEAGAPVVMVTDSVPCACLGELWAWLKTRRPPAPSSSARKDVAGTPLRSETLHPGRGEGPTENKSAAGLECPYCGEVGTLRPRGDKWRCEACRQLFTAEELRES